MQITLAVALAFAALWFVALRPKSATPAATTAPAQPTQVKTGTGPASGFGNAAARAQQGVAKANKAIDRNAAAQQSAGATDQAPAATPVAPVQAAKLPKSASAVAKVGGAQAAKLASATTPARPSNSQSRTDLPSPVRAAIDAHRVVVLLFWQSRSADDRAVRAEVARVSRRGGRVVVAVAPIGAVGRYEKITAGVDVEQSPTVLVVDRHRRAHRLTGFIDIENVEQAVTTALR